MADIPLKKMAQLIDSSDSDLSLAAIKVTGALCTKRDTLIVKALIHQLEQGDPELRQAAIDSLGLLGYDEALPRLLALVQAGGSELEPAVRAAGRLGKKGLKAITQLMEEVPPHLRRRIAGAMAHGATDNAILGALETLMDPEARVVEAAARSLSSEVPTLTEKQRHALAEKIISHLDSDEALTPVSEEALLRILGEIQMPEAEPIFWRYLSSKHSNGQRAVALEALAALGCKMSDSKLKQLFECAKERDFNIVSRALLLLQKVPVKGKAVSHWEELLTAPDIAARRLAIQQVKDVDSISVARALVPMLRHSHRGLQGDALLALQQSKKGRQALLEALRTADNPDAAWSLARALKPVAREITPTQRSEILKTAIEHQDDKDPQAKAFWFLLREMDPEKTTEEITERAQALRKKKKYEESLEYWYLLTRDPSCGPDIRFELAAVSLKLSNKDTAPNARNDDPCLTHFARLYQNTSFDLMASINKAKWLSEEDLFYLGFHFAEDPHKHSRDLGREILQLVVKRSPRTKIGKSAKSKLKTEGLSEK